MAEDAFCVHKDAVEIRPLTEIGGLPDRSSRSVESKLQLT